MSKKSRRARKRVQSCQNQYSGSFSTLIGAKEKIFETLGGISRLRGVETLVGDCNRKPMF